MSPNWRQIVGGMVLGSVIYAPFSMYFFGTTFDAVFERTLFLAIGALGALWCDRKIAQTPQER